MESLRHILVAVDFHGASLRAIEHAERIARSLDADITLIHTLDVPARAFSALPPSPELDADLRARARRDLDELVQRLREDGFRAAGFVRDGRPADEILDAALAHGADLVVIGTHGRRGLSRLMLGSVAEEIVRRSPTPVVTVHEWRFADRAAGARQLARAATPFCGELDMVLAITPGGVPLAVEVARTLGTPVDAFLVAPITPRGVLRGAACETGEFLLDDAAPGESILDASLGDAVAAARATAVARATGIRGTTAALAVHGKRVLVVTDELFTPAPAATAALALLRLGAKTVSLAVPVCSTAVLAALPPEIQRRICVDTTHIERPAARVYRDEEEPSNVAAHAMLVPSEQQAAAH